MGWQTARPGKEHVVHLRDHHAARVHMSIDLCCDPVPYVSDIVVRAAHSEKYANGGLTLTAYLLTPALKLPVRIFILVKCSPYPACAYTSLNLKSESLQTTSAVSVQKTAVFVQD